MIVRGMLRALILAAGLMLESFAHASTGQKLSFDRLVAEADLIVMGEVAELKTRQAPDRASVTTLVAVSVARQFKGAKVSSITIEQPGGAMGEVVQGVAGLPEFSSGENVIVFLKRQRDGAYGIVGGKQGKFSTKEQPGNKQQIVADFAHRTEPLDSFLKRLTKTVKSGS